MDRSGDRMMTPQHPLTVTLEAQQWDMVMRIMAKSPVPYEIVAPLIAAIQQQCAAAFAQVPTNGVGEEARADA